jgi:hypothetical protein
MGSDTASGGRLIRDRNFRLYLAARGFALLAMQIQSGGVGTILVVALWSRLFPELRRLDRFADVVPRAGRAAAPRAAILSSAATRSTRG